jgi:hypothetical protein
VVFNLYFVGEPSSKDNLALEAETFVHPRYPSLVLTCLVLLIYGVNETRPSQSFSSLLSLGLGTVSIQTVIFWLLPKSGTVGLVSNVLIANLPQLILSFAYFTYNALFTSMLAGLEWSQMAWQKKSLRVSQKPQGEQRSSYFLQLPYRYAIPLLGCSAVMHWLASQSIFLIAVERYDPLGNPMPADYSGVIEGEHYTCGWSPLAVLLVICGGVLMIAGAIVMGRRKYQPGMPLRGTNSAVVAAACHVAGGEENIERKKLIWGVVSKYDADGTGHCAFSSGEPDFPQEGVAYK